MPGIHLDEMLRFCGATTQVIGQSTFSVGGRLAAVMGDIDSHPSSVVSAMSSIAGMSGISGLGSLTGLMGNLQGLSGLSGLGSLSSITSLASGMSGLSSMLGSMNMSMTTLSSAMSGLGSLSGSGINITSINDLSAIASDISSVTGISIPGTGALNDLNALASAIPGGLSNLGSLSSLSSIPGIGSLGNFTNLAQGILGLGGSMDGLSNMMSSVGNAMMSGGPGALIPQSGCPIFVEGKQIILSMLDGSAPDLQGIIPHVTGLPTPGQGATDFTALGGLGTLAGGLGSFGLSGLPDIGEIMQVGSQVVGQVQKVVNQGGGSGLVVLNNMTSETQSLINAGTTIVSQTTGKTFTFSSYLTG